MLILESEIVDVLKKKKIEAKQSHRVQLEMRSKINQMRLKVAKAYPP
jgi:hypothetical protein